MCDGIYNQDTICTQNSPSGFFLLRTWLPTAQKRLLTHKEESTIMTTLEKIEGPSLALEQVRKWFIVNLDGASDTPGKTGKKVWKSAAQIEFLRTWLPTAQKRLLMHKEDSSTMTGLEKIEGPALTLEQVRKWFHDQRLVEKGRGKLDKGKLDEKGNEKGRSKLEYDSDDDNFQLPTEKAKSSRASRNRKHSDLEFKYDSDEALNPSAADRWQLALQSRRHQSHVP